MAETENPYASPDDQRMAAQPHGRPAPEDVDASFLGTGKATESWRLAVTPERLYFLLDASEVSFSLTRDQVASGLGVGSIGGKRTTVLLKEPEARVFGFPPEALEHVYGWLGDEAGGAFRQRILRSGWGSTLAVGLLFLIPIDLPETSTYLTWLAGGLLVLAALVSRFGKSAYGFLLRALGWGVLGALMLQGVISGDRSPWLLIVVALLSWGVLRYVRLFRFFAPPRKSD